MLKIRRFLDYKKCSCCGIEYLSYALQKINNTDYICDVCRMGESYIFKNYNKKGKERDISFSFEFETDSRASSLYELRKYGFVGCSDCTIGGLEWKSSIFYSKKSFHSVLKKIDKFGRFVGDRCGTHLHVSTKYKNKLETYKRELFGPILEVMKNNREQTIKFWGRFFNSYCRSSIGNDRYNSFNTQSSVETLEFRLLKFINAEQYIRASDFCINTTKYLNDTIKNNDINHERALEIGKVICNKYKEVVKDV